MFCLFNTREAQERHYVSTKQCKSQTIHLFLLWKALTLNYLKIAKNMNQTLSN